MTTTTTLTSQECIDLLNDLYEMPVPYKYLGVPIQFLTNKLKEISDLQKAESIQPEPKSE